MFINGKRLEVIERTKLLGVVCTSDGKFAENTKHIAAKGHAKIWFLRRLKLLGASTSVLTLLFKLFVRSQLEVAAPLWANSITIGDRSRLERVQRAAVAVLTAGSRLDYGQSLQGLGLCNLEKRRQALVKKQAIKMAEDTRYSDFFELRTGSKTRSKNRYMEPTYKTNRMKFSAIPSFLRSLNKEV